MFLIGSEKDCILVEFTNLTEKEQVPHKIFKALVFVFTLITQTEGKCFWERRHMFCRNRFNFSFYKVYANPLSHKLMQYYFNLHFLLFCFCLRLLYLNSFVILEWMWKWFILMNLTLLALTSNLISITLNTCKSTCT